MSQTSLTAQSREASKAIQEVKKLLAFQNASHVIIGEHLKRLKSDDLWRLAYGDTDQSQSWKEFVHYEFGVSESYASRAMDAYEILKIQLELSDEEIAKFDQNTVYQLIPPFKRGEITKKDAMKYLKMPREEARATLRGCGDEHNFGDEVFKRCTECYSFKKM